MPNFLGFCIFTVECSGGAITHPLKESRISRLKNTGEKDAKTSNLMCSHLHA